MFTLCSLRADRVGCLGSSRGLTPNIDRFAQGGTAFTRAYAQGMWTRPSHYAIFIGRYPFSTVDSHVLPEDETLAEILTRNGYETAAFVRHGNVSKDFGFERGFTCFDEGNSLSGTVSQVLGWLDGPRDHERPFFVFSMNEDAHPPHFGLPCPSQERNDPDVTTTHRLMSDPRFQTRILDGFMYPDEGFQRHIATRVERAALAADPRSLGGTPVPEGVKTHLVAHYDASIRHVDEVFGQLVAGLEQRGLLDSTVVIMLSDHGWDLFERGLFGHSHHGFDPIAHVALVMRGPGVKAGLRLERPVALMDVAPTIVSLAGCPPSTRHQGFDLLGDTAPSPRPVFSMGRTLGFARNFFTHVRMGRYELERTDNDPDPRIYDLESPDGDARPVQLAADSKDLAALLAAYAHEQALLPARAKLFPAPPVPPSGISTQTREYLQKNGYW